MKLHKTHWAVFFMIELVFILIEAKGLTHIFPGDENVYYYMAKSITEGNIPYRDFFYAHPPLHILILSSVIKIFGINFFILKTVNLLVLLIASFFLYKTSLELFRNHFNDTNAYIISILSLVLFLFSFQVIFDATFSIGMAFAFMFMIISFYCLLTKKYFISGFFGGLAGLTRLYAVVPILSMLVFIFIRKLQEKKLKDFYYFFLGFFMTFVVVVISLTITFGNNFTNDVIKYHLLKIKLPNQRWNVYKNVVIENWIIISAFFLSLFIKNKKRFQLFFFLIFAYLLFFLSLNVPTEFYLSLIFPFMSIVGAYSSVSLIREIRIKPIRYILIFLIAAIFIWSTVADVSFIEKIVFSEFEALKPLVSTISSSNPELKLFGDDSIISLLALMTNRSIALNYIDSNEMRFTSGLSNFYLFENQLNDVKLSYIILVKDQGLYQIEQFRRYIQSKCILEKNYHNFIFGYYLVYKCF